MYIHVCTCVYICVGVCVYVCTREDYGIEKNTTI